MNKKFNSTDTILMIRPKHFGLNLNTKSLNGFQVLDDELTIETLQEKALKEFDSLVEKLRWAGINIITIEDIDEYKLESAIYPNNWFSTHSNGDIYIYPMNFSNRRLEKYSHSLAHLQKNFKINKIYDLSLEENQDKFLEGTGSMVFDRVNKVAYASISQRTNEHLFHEFCKSINFQAISFNSVDEKGEPIYHTNVMLSVTTDLSIICLESVKDEAQKIELLESFERNNKTVVNVSYEQMKNFCCNVLEVRNGDEKYLVMSDKAYNTFSENQKRLVSKFCKTIRSDLSSIELAGGGGARCILTEIYLKPIN